MAAAKAVTYNEQVLYSFCGQKACTDGRYPNGRLRDEFLNETLFTSLPQARAALEEWRRDYNEVRPHSRIGWLAPAVYAAQFGPQWAKAPRLVEGHAPWPIATPEQMEKIATQTQLAAG